MPTVNAMHDFHFFKRLTDDFGKSVATVLLLVIFLASIAPFKGFFGLNLLLDSLYRYVKCLSLNLSATIHTAEIKPVLQIPYYHYGFFRC
jgi:hypothetical protein